MASLLVLIQLAGAVALLLLGLGMVRDGMVAAFGLKLKMILGFGTRSRLRAFVSGVLATIGLQSSTATALLTAQFVDRHMIGSRMAQIVLLGANVGTAMTAVILSTKVGALAPGLLLAGFVLRKRPGVVATGGGNAMIGIGLMLISLVLLKEATEPLRTSAELAAFLPMLDKTWLVALLLAAGIAVLCASSLAAVLLIASLQLPPELAIVMVLGANLGGAISPVLACAKLGVASRRVTVGNLVVRGIGCLLALPFVPLIAGVLTGLPVQVTDLAVEAHLAFNLGLALLVWPFSGLVSDLVQRLVPDEPQKAALSQRWLDEEVLATPPLALSGASREVLAIGDCTERMLEQTCTAFRKGDTSPLAEVGELETQVDSRQQAVKNYLSRLAGEVSEEDRRRTIEILDYVINLEHIGDIIDKGLGPEVRKKVGLGLRFSDEGYKELEGLFLMTQENLRMAQSVFMTRDSEMARKLMEMKVKIRNLERQSAQRHLIRLREGHSDSRETSSLHLDILRDLKRINAHAVSAAHPILDQEGLLIESRLRST